MTGTEMNSAIIEITNGKTSTELEKRFPAEYANLRVEIEEIKKSGRIVEIPSETP